MAHFLDDVAMVLVPMNESTITSLNIQSWSNLGYWTQAAHDVVDSPWVVSAEDRGLSTSSEKKVILLRYSHVMYGFGPRTDSDIVLPAPSETYIQSEYFDIELDRQTQKSFVHFKDSVTSLDSKAFAKNSMAELQDDAQISVFEHKFTCKVVRPAWKECTPIPLREYSPPGPGPARLGHIPEARSLPENLHPKVLERLQSPPILERKPDFNGYRKSILGGGGYGFVYKYECLEAGGVYAVKLVQWPTEPVSDTGLCERIKRESRLPRTIHHVSSSLLIEADD